MYATVVNVKIDAKTKKQAQKVAEELGFSLSALIKGYLKQLIHTKRVSFDLSEEPSEYLIQSLKEAEEDRKKGKFVSFKNPDDTLTYLDKMIKNEQDSQKN